MITIITALYPEAKPFVESLHLKKNLQETHYQLFEGDELRLLITGAGMIAAAAVSARHFSLYPPQPSDLVINCGIAGCTSEADTCIGDLFLISQITDQTTGRTYYPDLLYRNPFSLRSLTTVAAPCTDSSGFSDDCAVLIDMEAAALYQTLLPYFSPERMFFFKAVSDFPFLKAEDKENTPVTATQVTSLLSTHTNDILLFAREISLHLSSCFLEPSFTREEQLLTERLYHLLPMTESMRNEAERLFRYAKLASLPLSELLCRFFSLLPQEPIRGKKQAVPYFRLLKEQLLQSVSYSEAPLAASPAKRVSLYLPFFSVIYAEKDCFEENGTLPPGCIPIQHYKDIFNRPHQNFAEQKKAPSLIFAKKKGTLLYKGAPVCQNFGKEHFYYTSCMMNCVYHCDYCYLQGMYPSGHVVVFVNLEDYFSELEELLSQHPVYLCISYDTDLLAMEHRFGFVKRWLAFADTHPGLTLEIRTKSGNPAIFSELSVLCRDTSRIIFAWTVSPDEISRAAEHGAAPIALRLASLSAAKAAGFSVRLCFDPMLYLPDWQAQYRTLISDIFSKIVPEDLYDVSIGVFRISTEYLKQMRKKRPDCAIVQFPYITENGISHYGDLSEKMVHYMQDLLLKYLPAEKIFLWNGGEET